MDPIFLWIETSAFSTFLRESSSLWVFPFVLILHTVGLAFLVGSNVAFDVRILGVARGVPLPVLGRYFLVMWIGFWINLVSGVLLLIAYPTKAMTNPLFYAKLTLITLGLLVASRLRRDVIANPGDAATAKRMRLLAATSLAFWAAAITAGRLLAYTCTRLTAVDPC